MNQSAVDTALHDCLAHASSAGVTLDTMLERLGRAGFCFAALLLSVPFVQPLSLGPLNMIGGLTFMMIGWQLAAGREKPNLPKTARELKIQGKGWVGALKFCLRILGFCRRFTRVRCETWVTGTHGDRVVGWLILSGGLLLAVPMASLPLNNSLPALMILFACVGWLERDGLMVIVSLVWGVATLIYFTLVGLALFFFGTKVFSWIGALWPF
ncbi:MAG: exopolysaccharide biosynthesis protein [Blastochloris sp.]|nr:exopolysaccharide biosynthesis protein [Blastochloris sp.]